MGNDRVSLPRQLPRALRKLEAAVAAVLLVGGVLMLADLATSSLETTLREHVLLFSAFVLTTLGTAGVIWLLQDERRRVKDAVEEMRVRESIEATLLESVPNPVFSKNGDGIYVTCNDAFLEFVGRKRDEVIGKGVYEIFPPDRARLYERADTELFARGGSQRYEHSTTDARGVLRHFHIHKAVFRGATPSEGGIVGVLNDVTELVEERSRLQTTQRALEASLASKGELLAQLERARSRAEAASRAKSAFLANMSHEIRTPLHAILGMSEALADAGLPPAHLEAVEMIRTSGRALDSVIRDILDFSRIEAGKLAVIHEPMRVWQVVEEALDIVAPLAASKRLTLVPDIARDVPEWVASDPGRLRQILVNLLGNAVKFTERGEVVVHVRLQRARGSKSAATHDTALGRASIFFCVRDTGIGIPASRVDAMLEPFQQGDSSTTRRHEGTGLGLAISASLAKLLGGSLRIRSREGRGTSVIVTIEAQRLPRPVEAATTPFLEAEQPELRGKRALCVIEVPTQARAVRRMLSAWGMRVEMLPGAADLAAHLDGGDVPDVLVIARTAICTTVCAPLGECLSRGLRLPVLSLRWASTERPVPCLDHGVRNVTLPLKPSVLHRALVASLEPKAARDSALTPFAHGGEANGLASLRVLVADDNAINQRMAVKLLERLGLDATVVGDGVRAIGALAEQPYDVVLMDLRMPVMDGLEATRQIRANRNARQPYVIAMTADALPEHREECLAVGMNDYLPKPVGIAALREALERAVSALSAAHASAGS